MSRIPLLPNDTKISHLSTVTDVIAMKDVFQRQLPGFAEGRLQIDRLKLTDFHYKPGTDCHLCYTLRVKNLTTGSEGQQILFGVVVPGGAEARYAKAQLDMNFQPELGPAVHWLPELDMVLWGFPNDPELKQLHRLLDKNTLSELLQRFWSSFRFPPVVKLADITTEVVKYGPQDRCTLRHELHLEGGNDLVIYSKTFQEKTSGELIFKTIRTLWNAPFCQSGAVIIPEPLFFVREMNTIFVRGLEGVSADEHLADLDRIAAEIGAVLAGIHQCHIEGLPSCSDDRHATSQVAEAEEILGGFDAGYKARVEAIAKALWQKYPGLASVPAAPIHSAFRLSQILLVDGKLALIDFDDFLLSNPFSDVGSFVAHLLFLPLKGKLTWEQSRSAIRRFCRAYAARAPWGLPADVLAWQTAVYLVGKQAKKYIKRPKKRYREAVDQLLSLAVDILDGKLALM